MEHVSENKKHYAVLIPAYQPGESLCMVVDGLLNLGISYILVVNDGSDTRCDSVFASLESRKRVEVIRHPENRGKGAALCTGFRHILNRFNDFSGVVTADADGQHLPEDIKKVGDCLNIQPGAFILGARAFRKNVPFRSAFGNRMTQWIFRLLTGRSVTDTQSGLRGIPTALLTDMIALKSGRYEFELEMLLALHEKNIVFQEIPVTTVYEDNNQCSHFRPLTDSWRIYRVLLGWYLRTHIFRMIRYSMTSGLSTVVDFGVYSVLIGFSLDFVTASVIARGLSVMTHYSVNKYFTFAHRTRPEFTEITKYLSVTVLNLLCSIGLIGLFMRLFGLGEVISKVIAQLLLFLMTYILLSRFVFLAGCPCHEPESATRTGDFHVKRRL